MMPDRREAFLHALEDGPKTTRELSKAMDCGMPTVNRYGKHLVEEGSVAFETGIVSVNGGWRTRRTVWRLARWTAAGRSAR